MRDGPGHGQALLPGALDVWLHAIDTVSLIVIVILCVHIYFLNIYIYSMYWICSKTDSPKIGSKPFGHSSPGAPQAVSNLASTRHLSVWAHERCGRPSTGRETAEAMGHACHPMK